METLVLLLIAFNLGQFVTYYTIITVLEKDHALKK
jgi:hypothetical protein